MIHTGIYCFVNKINHKKYVGQSINIYDRKNQHKYRYSINTDSGYRSAFHAALRKYGWDNFSFYILEECSIEDLDRKEQHWIQKLNSKVPNGYNILSGGQSQTIDKSKHICPICHKTKSVKSKMCKSCYFKTKHKQKFLQTSAQSKKKYTSIQEEKIPKPCIMTDEDINFELIEEILNSSLEVVAKKNGYSSGNSLKKRLISCGYPGKKDALFKYYERVKGHKHPSLIAKEEKEKKKQAHIQKFSPKKVAQYDLEGNFIAIYPSTKEAWRQTGVNSGRISECANGKRKKAKGYIWKYIE